MLNLFHSKRFLLGNIWQLCKYLWQYTNLVNKKSPFFQTRYPITKVIEILNLLKGTLKILWKIYILNGGFHIVLGKKAKGKKLVGGENSDLILGLANTNYAVGIGMSSSHAIFFSKFSHIRPSILFFVSPILIPIYMQ